MAQTGERPRHGCRGNEEREVLRNLEPDIILYVRRLDGNEEGTTSTRDLPRGTAEQPAEVPETVEPAKPIT